MRPLLTKIKPARGFAHIAHLGLVALLPLLVFVLVRLPSAQPLALIVILLSKWRMLAVRPRFWLVNIRANGIDIIVGISIFLFMTHTTSALFQLGWAIIYAVWLLAIKPASSTPLVALQAIIGQFVGLTAVFLALADKPLAVLVLVSGIICFVAARHYFDAFEEPYARLLSYFWGYFGAALTWLLGHWLLYYAFIAQPTLVLSILGYGLAGLYHLDHYDRLNNSLKRQLIFMMVAILVVVLALSDWGNKVV